MKHLSLFLLKAFKLALLLFLIQANPIQSYGLGKIDSIPKKVYENVDQAPNFPGGATGWLNFLKKNQKLPTAVLEGNVYGSVVIQFIVDETGTVHKPVVTEKPLGDLETMEEAMRLYKLMPKWIPATLGGKKVSAYAYIEVPFGDVEIVDMIVEEAPSPLFELGDPPLPTTSTNEIFKVTETMPTFVGGQAALLRFMGQNLQYPPIAKANGVEGHVVVQMIVEKDGTLNNLKIVKGIGAGCDSEALRLVQSMPKWKPGTNRVGAPVRVQYNLPITFKLE